MLRGVTYTLYALIVATLVLTLSALTAALLAQREHPLVIQAGILHATRPDLLEAEAYRASITAHEVLNDALSETLSGGLSNLESIDVPGDASVTLEAYAESSSNTITAVLRVSSGSTQGVYPYETPSSLPSGLVKPLSNTWPDVSLAETYKASLTRVSLPLNLTLYYPSSVTTTLTLLTRSSGASIGVTLETKASITSVSYVVDPLRDSLLLTMTLGTPKDTVTLASSHSSLNIEKTTSMEGCTIAYANPSDASFVVLREAAGNQVVLQFDLTPLHGGQAAYYQVTLACIDAEGLTHLIPLLLTLEESQA